MKLFLHWLRWDLRRFRLVLLIWTLLVVCYAVFLGWLHLNILTIDLGWMRLTGSLAAVLGLGEIFLLLHLFTADPAGGAAPFWKTKPPTGYAVAGAKLVIGLCFFVAVPMLAWLAMRAWCGIPENNIGRWGSLTWTQTLWWLQTALVGAITLAASRAKGPGLLLARLALGLGLMFVGVVYLVLLRQAYPTTSARAAVQGIFTLPMAVLYLLVGTGLFFVARRHRTPRRWTSWPVTFAPLLFLVPAAWFAPGEDAALFERNLPEAGSQVREGIKVGPIRLSDGGPFLNAAWSSSNDPGWKLRRYVIRLHLSGLPERTLAVARWLDLRLRTPDGRTIEADAEALRTGSYHAVPPYFPTILMVNSAPFAAKDLAALAFQNLRAEGTVRVVLIEEHREPLSLQPGLQQSSPLGGFDIDALGISKGKAFEVSWVKAGGLVPFRFTIDTKMPRGELESSMARTRHGESDSRFLMEYQRISWDLYPSAGQASLRDAQFRKAAKAGNVAEDWVVNVSWREPVAVFDLPVSLENFVLPAAVAQDWDRAAAIMDSLRIQSDDSSVEVKRTLKHAIRIMLSAGGEKPGGKRARDGWPRLLGMVPRHHREVMLEILREDPATEGILDSYHKALIQRIVDFTGPEDIPGLRADPGLFWFLKHELSERGLIPSGDAQPQDEKTMSDQQLKERWEKSTRGKLLHRRALEESLKRGQGWAMAAAAEVVELLPDSESAEAILKFLPAVSACPDDSLAAAQTWLAAQAGRLVWDAAGKKWVVPPGPEVR